MNKLSIENMTTFHNFYNYSHRVFWDYLSHQIKFLEQKKKKKKSFGNIKELGSLIATFVIQNEPEINHIVLKNVVSTSYKQIIMDYSVLNKVRNNKLKAQ